MKDNKKSRPLKILLGALFALLLIYLAVQLYTVMNRTYRSEIAIPYQLTDNVMLDGVLVYEETPLEGHGIIGYLVEDGARVAGGNVVAEVYTSEEQAQLREELTQIEKRIALLQKAQNTNASGEISVISAQMKTDLYNLLDVLDSTNMDGFSEAADAYLLSANRLQVYTGEETDYTPQIEELQNRRDGIRSRLGSLTTIEAGQAGYFVSADNCCFLQADRETLDEMKPAQLQAFLQGNPEKPADGSIGKIISGYVWYYYGVCDLKTAEKFENASGKQQISFPGKEEETLPVTIQRVDVDVDAGLATVVLRCEYTNQEVLKLCHQTAQVDFNTYSGLRIDKKALHILDNQKGVYIKYGSIERWRKIQVVYENEDYILVPAKPNEESELKIYDEVIVEGSDLRDGKLL